jgi:hypothetical protein
MSKKNPATPRVEINVDGLTIEHDTPMPAFRSKETDKYGALFATMKPGSCIVCPDTIQANRVSGALRKKIDRGDLPRLAGCSVVSRNRCPDDGKSRVWAMPVDQVEKVPRKPKAPKVGSKLAAGAPWPSAGAK